MLHVSGRDSSCARRRGGFRRGGSRLRSGRCGRGGTGRGGGGALALVVRNILGTALVMVRSGAVLLSSQIALVGNGAIILKLLADELFSKSIVGGPRRGRKAARPSWIHWHRSLPKGLCSRTCSNRGSCSLHIRIRNQECPVDIETFISRCALVTTYDRIRTSEQSLRRTEPHRVLQLSCCALHHWAAFRVSIVASFKSIQDMDRRKVAAYIVSKVPPAGDRW